MDENWILSCLKKPLGAKAAHEPFLKNRMDQTFGHSKQNARQAAVAIHLYPENGNWFFILIKRSIYQGFHSGQIAFPGGKYDRQDQNLAFTARRETYEEIGIGINIGKQVRALTKVWIPVSGFEVSPFVFIHKCKPKLAANDQEVAQILIISISNLIDPKSISTTNIVLENGMKLENVACFEFNNEIVWGATALIINELRMLFAA